MKLLVKVRPNSNTSSLEQDEEGNWQAKVKSPPVDNRANDELLRLVAKHFGVPKSRVEIKSGGASRSKLVLIRS